MIILTVHHGLGTVGPGHDPYGSTFLLRSTSNIHLPKSKTMRRLIALAILFFVIQTTAAMAAPVDPCCFENCKTASCSMLVCPTCVAPVAVSQDPRHPVFQIRDSRVVVDEPIPGSTVQAIWRPPE